MTLLLARVRLRRPPGGGHFLFGLHRQPWLLLLVIVIIVVISLAMRRK